MASRNIRLASAMCAPRRRYHADTPPITKHVVMKAASTMCERRYGNEGLKMISHHEAGWNTPCASTTWPCGVCIQLFAAMIQNVEINVPSATMQVAKKCSV